MPETKYLHPPMTRPMVLPRECFGVWDANYHRTENGEVWVYVETDPPSGKCQRVAYPVPTDRPLVLRERGRTSDDRKEWVPEKHVILGGDLDESCYATPGGTNLRVLSPDRAHSEALRVARTELWLREARKADDQLTVQAAAAGVAVMAATAEDDFIRARAAGFPPPEPMPRT